MNLAGDSPLPQRVVLPQHTSRRSLHPLSRISQSRPPDPLPAKIATASCSPHPAESGRRSLQVARECALPPFPHPAAPASPRAPQNLPAPPESQSSLFRLRILLPEPRSLPTPPSTARPYTPIA